MEKDNENGKSVEMNDRTILSNSPQAHKGYEGLGKAVPDSEAKGLSYPAQVVGNLVNRMNDVDKSVKPAKALGQSMLVGLLSFVGSVLVGNGILPSLLFGIGGGIFGQEIMTCLGNVGKGISGKTTLGSREFLTSTIPMALSLLLSCKLGPGKAIFTTLLGTALGSRLSNQFLGSNLGERYYGDEYINAAPDPAVQEKKGQQAEKLERGKAARPDIEQEQHSTGETASMEKGKVEPRAACDSITWEHQTTKQETESHESRNKIKMG